MQEHASTSNRPEEKVYPWLEEIAAGLLCGTDACETLQEVLK